MSLYSMIAGKGPSGFGYGSTAEDVTEGMSLAGKTILITGCNSGIGFEAFRVLAMRGARVVGTSRTVDKAQVACDKVSGETIPMACELSDPQSVRMCVAGLTDRKIKLDAIICNAGIMALPKLETVFGYELQFFTNHIGHFMLVTGLLDRLTDTGRVVMVSSDAHRRAPKEGIQFDNLDGSKGYSPFGNYGQSKLANILFANELAKRFAGTKKTANSLHPGVIATNLTRSMNPFVGVAFFMAGPVFLKSIPQGASTEVYCATNPQVADISGKFFSHNNIGETRPDAMDEGLAKKLWEVSEKIVAGLPS
ncbi:MAG: SDR family oxidoreductase [Polyangiaceae bacterium]